MIKSLAKTAMLFLSLLFLLGINTGCDEDEAATLTSPKIGVINIAVLPADPGDTITIEVTVTPRKLPIANVTIDLSNIGGIIITQMYDDGTNGDANLQLLRLFI